MSSDDFGSPTFDRSASEETGPLYVLRLYVSGASWKSLHAFGNIKSICAEALEGRYDLEVVDLYQAPARAAADQIVATPTLVKEAPPPSRRLIGTLSNAGDVSKALGIPHINVNPPVRIVPNEA